VNRIAVLIPAYKTGYLKPLFESLRRQTVRMRRSPGHCAKAASTTSWPDCI
jgi:hypothetical protein